jgi:hypothetical protein
MERSKWKFRSADELVKTKNKDVLPEKWKREMDIVYIDK